jgi:hypothetical protein
MRNLRIVRRGDDLPLYGIVTRVRTGRYEVIIKFVASKRILHKEQIGAPNVTAAKLFFRCEYPTLTWGPPKYPKLRMEAKARVRKPKRVTRKSKRKPHKRRKKTI